MAYGMHDPSFRQRMVGGLRDPQIRPVNELVDRWCDRDGRGWMPHVAPSYGGVNAEVLLLLSDPGPMTNTTVGGSGFLCAENADPGAARLADLLLEVGVAQERCVSWNAYPWYRHGAEEIRVRHIEAGLPPLIELLGILVGLRVVMLLGGNAVSSWARLRRWDVELANRCPVFETFHTGNRAFAGVGVDIHDRRLAEQRAIFEEMVSALLSRGARDARLARPAGMEAP